MNAYIEAPRFSVYLGGGLYLGGIVYGEPIKPNHVPMDGHEKSAALAISRADDAAIYARDAAVRVCHFARRSGLSAWLVQAVPV